ncbi:MAG: hypothetical protein RL277_610 [Planctomycetota bacterium]|jgi:hypothetical protein
MNPSSKKLDDARRRLFEVPAPSSPLGTPEFRRTGILMLILLGVAAFAIYLQWERASRAEKEAQEAAELAALGTPVPNDPALREQRRMTLFQGALADSNNGEDFRETSGYSNLLRAVREYPPEEVREKSRRWLDWEGAAFDPDGWRGEFCRYRGVFAGFSAVKLGQPVLGSRDVWRGFLMEPDKSEPVVFDLICEESEVPVPKIFYDAWDIEGVFYRTVRYEDREGRMQEIPYVIARSLKPVDIPADKLGFLENPIVTLVVVVGLALLLARLLILYTKTRATMARPRLGSQAPLGPKSRPPSPPTPPASHV